MIDNLGHFHVASHVKWHFFSIIKIQLATNLRLCLSCRDLQNFAYKLMLSVLWLHSSSFLPHHFHIPNFSYAKAMGNRTSFASSHCFLWKLINHDLWPLPDLTHINNADNTSVLNLLLSYNRSHPENEWIIPGSILELFQPHDSLFSNKWRWRRRHELELFQQSMDYILTCIDNPRLLHTLGFVFCDNGKGRSRGLLIQVRRLSFSEHFISVYGKWSCHNGKMVYS